MDIQDELFTITGEECSELIMAISKYKRFGPSKNTEQALKQEIADVSCMVALLMQHGYISEEELSSLGEKKMNKLKKYSNLL